MRECDIFKGEARLGRGIICVPSTICTKSSLRHQTASKQAVKKIIAYLRTAILLEKSLGQKYFEVVDARRNLDTGERKAVLELFVISTGMPSRKLKGQSLKAARVHNRRYQNHLEYFQRKKQLAI
jgi:hypothetical protein